MAVGCRADQERVPLVLSPGLLWTPQLSDGGGKMQDTALNFLQGVITIQDVTRLLKYNGGKKECNHSNIKKKPKVHVRDNDPTTAEINTEKQHLLAAF